MCPSGIRLSGSVAELLQRWGTEEVTAYTGVQGSGRAQDGGRRMVAWQGGQCEYGIKVSFTLKIEAEKRMRWGGGQGNNVAKKA